MLSPSISCHVRFTQQFLPPGRLLRDSQRDARVMLASSAGALSQRLGCSRRPKIRTRGARPPGPPAGGKDVTIHDVSVRARRKPSLVVPVPDGVPEAERRAEVPGSAVPGPAPQHAL